MKLLEAGEVKKNEKVFETSQRERVKKLNAEESILTRRLNDTKEKTELGIKKLETELTQFEKSTEEKKKTLTLEISSLESRKKEALKPIHDTKNEAEKLLKSAKAKEIELERDRKALNEAQEDLLDRLEHIADTEGEIANENIEIENKKKLVESAELKLKKSQIALSEAWAKYHLEVGIVNKDLVRREKEVEDGKKANEIIREQQEKRAKEQDEHDRQIADRYGTLGRAIEEAKLKYKIKID